MGTSYLGQTRSKVDNARAMFMCITLAILNASQRARTSSPEFYCSSHVPALPWKVGQVSTRALLFLRWSVCQCFSMCVSVCMCACAQDSYSCCSTRWKQRAALYNLQALPEERKRLENRDRTSVDETMTKSGLFSNSFTSSFFLLLLHILVAAKRSLASNTPLQGSHCTLGWCGLFLAIAVQLSPWLLLSWHHN